MARNYYSEIYLHTMWHTKESRPLLMDVTEQFVHHYLRQKIVNTEGAFVFEIGGTENHVHIAVRIAPNILISEFVGRLKGASSHEVNQCLFNGRKEFEWQAGYGVVSFGKKDLDWVVSYIQNQKEHHRSGKAFDRLERVTDVEEAQATRQEAP